MYKIILGLILFFSLERFCYWQTDGFRFSKVTTTHEYPFISPYESPPPSVHQSFHYLGKGVQFYVFIGDDQQTILKLFKHHHAGLSTDTAKLLLPQHLASSILERRERRVIRLFKSTEIALKDLPQETGVFYTHLNKSASQLGKIKLYDKLKIVHELDLDQTEFILQKRAIPLEEKLHSLFATNQTEKAIDAMQRLLKLLDSRSIKGVKNKDGGHLIRNCGFIGDDPVEIDVGSFIYSEGPLKSKKPINKLLQWVENNYPNQLQQCKAGLIENPSCHPLFLYEEANCPDPAIREEGRWAHLADEGSAGGG